MFKLEGETRARIISLATGSQVLVFGEIHGTQEVPALIRELLDDFQATDFGMLALELPHAQQEELRAWALQKVSQPPEFFTHPFGDGRGNEQVLELVREAILKQWSVVCFDDFGLIGGTWRQRDQAMAEILIKEWNQNCPNKKVVAVCGNMHSTLTQTRGLSEKFWPSFAANLQMLKPNTKVKSVNVIFHQGEFFNGRIRRIHGSEIHEPYISVDTSDGHSAALHITSATAATHLAKPPSMFFQLIRVATMLVAKFTKQK